MTTLRSTQTLIVLLLGVLLSLFTPVLRAQDEIESDSEAQVENQSYGDAVKEIFMQGSLDGNSMFLVLGFEDASAFAKKALKNAVDIENLRDIRRDIDEAALSVRGGAWNNQHEGDIVGAYDAGLSFSSKHAKKILSSPLKSLANIPKSYRANFELARAAYYETDNQVLASVKYAGIAVWANVEGAYYLVIEAPIKFATNLVATTLGVPLAVVGHAAIVTMKLAIDTLKISIKIAGHLMKSVLSGAAAVVTMAYSGISTGVAIIATSAAAGAVAAVNGIKWLVTTPFKAWNGTHIKLSIEPEQLSLDQAVELLSEDDVNTLNPLGVELDDVVIKGNQFKKEITFYKIFDNKLKSVAEIKLKRKNGKIEISGYLKNRLIKQLYENDELTRREERRNAKADFLTLILKKLNQE